MGGGEGGNDQSDRCLLNVWTPDGCLALPQVGFIWPLLLNIVSKIGRSSQISFGTFIGREKESCLWYTGHMARMAATPIYGRKPFKIGFHWNQRTNDTVVRNMTSYQCLFK